MFFCATFRGNGENKKNLPGNINIVKSLLSMTLLLKFNKRSRLLN